MKAIKKRLALLLAVVMLVSLLPTVAIAAEEDEVIYNLSDMEITVGNDEEKLETSEVPYDLFDENGNYTIWLEDDAFFPYEVQFTYEGETWTEWFEDEEDTVEIGGHVFSVTSNVVDPMAPVQIGLRIGDELLPIMPEEKEFTSEPQMMPFSMLPLREKRASLNMRGYFPEELKEVSFEVVTSGTEIEGEIAVWAKWGHYDEDGDYVDENDDYTVVTEGSTIDLSSGYEWEDRFYLELIVGTADQLNMENIRYRVNVYLSYAGSELFEASAYTGGDSRNEIRIFDSYRGTIRQYVDGAYHTKNYLELEVDPAAWKYGDTAWLSLNLTELFSALTATVYEGYYETAESIPADAVDITSQIWEQPDLATQGGYLADYSYKSGYQGMPEITVVLKRDEKIVKVMPMFLEMYQGSISLSWSGDIYAENETGERKEVCWDHDYDYDDHRAITLMLNEEYPADGTYYYNFYMHNPDPEGQDGIALVQKAVVGEYDTAADIPEDAEDIKEQLFSSAYTAGGGYGADYSNGIIFTIVDIYGEVHVAEVKTVEYSGSGSSSESLPSAPRPESADTYFQMLRASEAEDRDGYIVAYTMPHDADSYYYNGFQTVFLLNRDYLDGEAPVVDANIIPEFYTGSKVEMFAGHDGSSGTKQISEETIIPFEHGKAIQYSAAAENASNLKNYWVTFLTQQSGPKLFVNATNEESTYVKITDTESGAETTMPQREVFLTEEYDNHHDVFFANVGDEDITGLYVKLEDAQNIALDEYWTIGDTTTLRAFTTVFDNVNYGSLANFAKIRLIPAKDAEGNELIGVIGGTLVIGYTGTEGQAGEEIRIHLTGIAGAPKITTTSVVEGVKYVPYSSMIQTNNMYASDAVSFELDDGELPDGLELKENGEIYGIPAETGEYTFTVKAVYNEDDQFSDSKEFTLVIQDNTKENVAAVNSGAQGYPLLDAVPDELDVDDIPAEGQVFRSEGAYDEFMAFYLDGEELVKGEDYEAEEGSTKITIRAQTFKNAGNGTHTIAAEFRTNGSENGTMKRTAQNVEISGAGSDRGSISDSKPAIRVEETVAEQPEIEQPVTADGVFADVSSNDWFYGDVEWAYQEGLMIGVSDTAYEPMTLISPAMVVTTLARLDGADLSAYEEFEYDDIEKGQWYTAAALWARQSGIMSEEDTFSALPPMIRARFAVMLVKYLETKGVDCTLPEELLTFADADVMTAEENAAFQILYKLGIFKGVGEYDMDAQGSTTRAQLAALLHRVSAFVEKD